jgi:hypothetical protein
MERASPDAPLLTSCLIIASPLVIRLRSPFSLITTGSPSASSSSLDTFFEPLTRPAGLPDLPFSKRVLRGGLA